MNWPLTSEVNFDYRMAFLLETICIWNVLLEIRKVQNDRNALKQEMPWKLELKLKTQNLPIELKCQGHEREI